MKKLFDSEQPLLPIALAEPITRIKMIYDSCGSPVFFDRDPVDRDIFRWFKYIELGHCAAIRSSTVKTDIIR